MAENKFLSRINPNYVLIAIGAWAGYSYIISPLLETLGLKKSQTQIDNEQAPLKENNPWSNNFWKQQNGALILTYADTQKYLKTLAKYQGLFNDNFNSVFGVFQALKTKSQVSYLCEAFFKKYNASLYNFLKDGSTYIYWPGTGLSADHIAAINAYVNSLPDFFKK